jgi:ferredoxin
LQLINVERASGEEFIHRGHNCNDANEFPATTVTRDALRVMPNKNDRVLGNVPGPFYVDMSCIDCDMCRETAPDSFRRNDDVGFSIVYQQPLTPEQLQAATEAMNGCPTESIGNDG